jgi:heme exporter protein C
MTQIVETMEASRAFAEDEPRVRRGPAPLILIALGAALFALGSWYGLMVAPAEHYMGETQRIMYVHVPTAWTAIIALAFAFVSSIAWLIRGGWKWDARLEAGAEIGTLLALLLCIQGAIWAKPTWGVWWDWDPRLTTSAVMVFAFAGILALRRYVTDPGRRATWSAVTIIVAFVDVPIVYFSVNWWNSLHQTQSTPETVAAAFRIPLYTNAVGFLIFAIGLIMIRARAAEIRLRDEIAPPLHDLVSEEGALR